MHIDRKPLLIAGLVLGAGVMIMLGIGCVDIGQEESQKEEAKRQPAATSEQGPALGD